MRMSLKSSALSFAVLVALAGCGSGFSTSDGDVSNKGGGPTTGGPGGTASCTYVTTAPIAKAGGAGNTRQEIPVAATGDTMVVQVFEPKKLDVGGTYPLVLQGHGYGGSRNTTPDGFQQRLIDAGYYVISIDERGFGESSGTVRVMDPEYEGKDLVAVLDWAEKLPGLRRCQEDGKMVVGSYGGSYGGMYQFLLMGSDQQKQRLHIIAPDITPHDLTYSLTPNGVVKSGYGLVLLAGGESNPRKDAPPPRQDPILFESLINAVTANSFSASSTNFFKYHSVAYFCDGQPAGPQSFLNPQAVPDVGNIAAKPFPKADVLLTQGFRDTLFNFNEAYGNFQCMKALGGDVRLLTHESGHILPISLTSVPPSGGLTPSTPIPSQNLEGPLDPFYAAVTFPNFQDAGGARNCGSIVLNDVQFAWFEEKLQGKTGVGLLDTALKGLKQGDTCLSLGAGDAIAMSTVKQGGTPYDVKTDTPQFNSALGVLGSVLGNGVREQILATQAIPVPAGAVAIAGLPTMSLNIAGLTGQEMATCPVAQLNLAACDPILFLGIGHRAKGTTRWDLIDDQLTPIRGFGDHGTADKPMLMSGIAERINPDDEVALLIYAFHAQYPVTWSRDLLVPAVKLTGKINLPFIQASEITASFQTAGDAPSGGGGGGGGLCAPDQIPGIGGQCLPAAPGGLPALPAGGAGGLPSLPTGGGLPSLPSGLPGLPTGGGSGLCAPSQIPGIGGQCLPSP